MLDRKELQHWLSASMTFYAGASCAAFAFGEHFKGFVGVALILVTFVVLVTMKGSDKDADKDVQR